MMGAVGRLLFMTVLMVGMPACGPGLKPDFEAGFARQREMAIIEEVRKGHSADVRAIVRMLDASEPSTRMIAIDGLERLTGETFGYDAFGPQDERAAAIERWVVYVNRRESVGGAQ